MSTPCRCEEGAYVGAQLVTEPTRCERCGGLVDDEAAAYLERLYTERRERLREWGAANPGVLGLDNVTWEPLQISGEQENPCAAIEPLPLAHRDDCGTHEGYMCTCHQLASNRGEQEASWSLPPCGHLECADHPETCPEA